MGMRVAERQARREILRGAVEDNIEALTGQPAGTLRRRRERRTHRLRRTLVTVGLIGLAGISVAAWFTLPQDAPDDHAPTPAPAPVVVMALGEDESDGSDTPAARLSRQKPQDLMQQVIPLNVKKVVIDPGHGGRDGGTSLKYGLLEKDITRDIADRLVDNLDRANITTVLTRHGDEWVSLKQRTAIANEAEADLFVSIHVNWLPNRHARGVETYYLGTTDDPFLNNLAAAENRDSGFTVADSRRLLKSIYADVRQAESKRLARTIQGALFETLKKQNERIVSRGVMTAPFVVLVATEMPAVLAEVACLSNDNEARLLAIPSYRQRIADALYAGIIQYSATVTGTRVDDPEPTSPKGTAEHGQREHEND